MSDPKFQPGEGAAVRFTVELYGAHAFSAATHDELYAKIAEHHSARQKAAQFRIERRLNEGYGSYVITDHWQAAA